MTEYELATLAARHAGIWIAAAHVVVGLMQCGIVAYGIRAMQTAGDRRAAEQDQRHVEAMRRQDQHHVEAMRRQDQHHVAAMRALETLIERTAPPG